LTISRGSAILVVHTTLNNYIFHSKFTIELDHL
jgi:hypothetical protein